VIGLVGCFDTDALGDQLIVRVARAELARRLPHCSIRAFAPLGSLRPSRFDGGEVVEPLVPADAPFVRALDQVLALVVLTGDLTQWTTEHLIAEYALDAVTAARVSELALVGGGIRAPRAWHAVSNVESVRATLPAFGSPAPHPAALAASVVGHDVLARRLGFARAMGWCPASDDFVVAQCDEPAQAAEITAAARAVAGETGARAVVVVPAGRDDAGIESLAASLSTSHVVPAFASVDDRVAVTHAARAVVARSPALQAITSPPERLASLHDDYDAIAALVGADTRGPLVPAEVAALRAALDARGRRLAAERVAFADALRAAHSERDAAHAELAARSPVKASVPARVRGMLRRLRGTQPS
jgi:hypothetical protein